ncbi:MAG: Rrf2 family transcriptional regulator [Candidatus Melainabacteria bacterium]|nr:Rrf2 family transcriptional regulator [Candidatus Melainabacteria bacterium]
MISQTAEYALRAAVCLAQYAELPLTTQQIASVTGVPAGYLSKVLQSLVKANLVMSQRGLKGGFVLGRRASSLTILEIVNAVDPIKRIVTCPLGIETHGVNLCPLHKRIDEAIAMVETSFAESTLAQLLASPSKITPLCALPSVANLEPRQTINKLKDEADGG